MAVLRGRPQGPRRLGVGAVACASRSVPSRSVAQAEAAWRGARDTGPLPPLPQAGGRNGKERQAGRRWAWLGWAGLAAHTYTCTRRRHHTTAHAPHHTLPGWTAAVRIRLPWPPGWWSDGWHAGPERHAPRGAGEFHRSKRTCGACRADMLWSRGPSSGRVVS